MTKHAVPLYTRARGGCGAGLLAVMVVMAGCAPSALRAVAPETLGPVGLGFDGGSFVADLDSEGGLAVGRDPQFGNDEGKLAKDVAVQFCASRQRQLHPQSYGRFISGLWVFKEGCA